MPDARFMESNDKEILLIDLSHLTASDGIAPVIDRAITLVGAERSADSLRTLLDLSGTRINNEVVAGLKRLSASNGRYAKATAFVGLGIWWSGLLSIFFLLKGKSNHKVLSRRDVAAEWLEKW